MQLRFKLISIIVTLAAVGFGMFLEKNHSFARLGHWVKAESSSHQAAPDAGLDYNHPAPASLVQSLGAPKSFHKPGDRYIYATAPETIERNEKYGEQVAQYRYISQYQEALAYLTSPQLQQAQAKAHNAFWQDNAQTAGGFEQAMQSKRAALKTILGVYDQPPAGKILSRNVVRETSTYRIEKATMQSRLPNVTIQLYIGTPKAQAPKGSVVAIHGYSGVPEKVMGLEAMDYTRHFGLDLLKKNYVVYAPYVMNLGIPNENISAAGMLYSGESHFAIDLQKLFSIVDYIKQQPDQKENPIISYGISYGGTLSALFGALDTRVDALISSGALGNWHDQFKDYYSHINRDDIRGNYVIFNQNLYRLFEYADLAKLVFPRVFIAEVGALDELNAHKPDVEWHKIQKIYERFHLPQKAQLAWFLGYHENAPEVTWPILEKSLNSQPTQVVNGKL